MKIIKSITIVLIAFLFSACESEDSEILNNLVGDWKITTVAANIKVVDESPQKFTYDLKDYNYILTFAADGSIKIKADEATLKKLNDSGFTNVKELNSNGGTYSISGKYITFTSADNKTSKFIFSNPDANTFVIEHDKALYFEQLRAEIEKEPTVLKILGISIDEFIKEIEATLLEYNTSITYKRV